MHPSSHRSLGIVLAPLGAPAAQDRSPPSRRFSARRWAGSGGAGTVTSMLSDNASVRVFLADDSAAIRERIARLLTLRSMAIVGEAETPQASIDGILAAHPDVVVLDCQLEGGTGLQVLRAVRAADPSIAFVVFSNSSAPPYRKRYLGEGARAFLDKTSEFDQLAAAVADASGQIH